MPGLDIMRSKSVAHLSSVKMIFKPGTDLAWRLGRWWPGAVARRTPNADMGRAARHAAAAVGHQPRA